ncbi:MAG: pyridoxamine 5'-phosphate oxidase family protein [Armatimonadetes bacterium]|nr:pyridoxamine 5'-phosphate oxidase family protein [Armatimonadota bacterium]
MPDLPETVIKAWDQREGPAVLATVSDSGQPNAIYVGAIKLLDACRFVISDSSFHKTRANIANGSLASVLFLTTDYNSYQIYGRLEYMTSGEVFDDLPNWIDPQYPPVAAVVVHVEEVYNGAVRLA